MSCRTALRPYLLIAPSLIFLLLLFLVPLVQTIALAFRTSAAAGFGNFGRMAGTTSISSMPRRTRSRWLSWWCRCSLRWRSAWR